MLGGDLITNLLLRGIGWIILTTGLMGLVVGFISINIDTTGARFLGLLILIVSLFVTGLGALIAKK